MDFENKNNQTNDRNAPEMQQEGTTAYGQDAQTQQNVSGQPNGFQQDAFHMTGDGTQPSGQSYQAAQEPQQDPAAQTPFSQPSHPAYTTYQEWMRQEDKHAAKRAKKAARRAKRQGKNHRKPAIIVGSVAAACVLLAGGIAIGSSFASAGAESAATVSTTNSNLPTVNITSPSTTTSSSDDGLSGEEIYAKVSPSVVSIQAVNVSTGSGGTGSGVIMSADGYIITNNHVVVDEDTGEQLDKITVISVADIFAAAIENVYLDKPMSKIYD